MLVEKHRTAVVLAERLRQPGAPLLVHACIGVCPTDPKVAVLLVQGSQACGEASHAAFEGVPARAVVFEPVGEAIRHDDEPPGLRKTPFAGTALG